MKKIIIYLMILTLSLEANLLDDKEIRKQLFLKGETLICVLITSHLDSPSRIDKVHFYELYEDAEKDVLDEAHEYHDRYFNTFDELRVYEDSNPQNDYFHYIMCDSTIY